MTSLVRHLACLFGFAALFLALAAPARAEFAWAEIAADLSRPSAIRHSGDGTNRLFITEQHTGLVRILDLNTLEVLPDPFLDITEVDTLSNTEDGGLLGIAFHPDYERNGLFYVSYTRTDLTNVVARFNVSPNDTNVADPSSLFLIIEVPQTSDNHNAGDIHFGNDRMLYYSLGDGGDEGDPLQSGQNTSTLLGKILRIDVDTPSDGKNYSIPADNVLGNEIFVYGLRNPWRFSFDRLTGDLWIGDVGQERFEEVDFKAANESKLFTTNGENYGWNNKEGFELFPGGAAANGELTDPVVVYPHQDGLCRIVGGYVYRGFDVPELYGSYLFGDYCTGRLFQLFPSNNSVVNLTATDGLLTTFGEDEWGSLYHCVRNGSCFKLLNSGEPVWPVLNSRFQLYGASENGTINVGSTVTINIDITNVGNGTQRNNFEREFNLTFPQYFIKSTSRNASIGTISRNIRGNFFWWNGSLQPGETATLTIQGLARRPGTFCFNGATAFDEKQLGFNTGSRPMTGDLLCFTVERP